MVFEILEIFSTLFGETISPLIPISFILGYSVLFVFFFETLNDAIWNKLGSIDKIFLSFLIGLGTFYLINFSTLMIIEPIADITNVQINRFELNITFSIIFAILLWYLRGWYKKPFYKIKIEQNIIPALSIIFLAFFLALLPIEILGLINSNYSFFLIEKQTLGKTIFGFVFVLVSFLIIILFRKKEILIKLPYKFLKSRLKSLIILIVFLIIYILLLNWLFYPQISYGKIELREVRLDDSIEFPEVFIDVKQNVSIRKGVIGWFSIVHENMSNTNLIFDPTLYSFEYTQKYNFTIINKTNTNQTLINLTISGEKKITDINGTVSSLSVGRKPNKFFNMSIQLEDDTINVIINRTCRPVIDFTLCEYNVNITNSRILGFYGRDIFLEHLENMMDKTNCELFQFKTQFDADASITDSGVVYIGFDTGRLKEKTFKFSVKCE